MSFSPTKSIAKVFRPFKKIPYLPILIDSQIKVYTLFFKPQVFKKMIEINEQIKCLPKVKSKHHKYGGLEYQVNNKEFCHIHSDGLIDVILNRKIANDFIEKDYCEEHHVMPDTGWVSHQINKKTDLTKILEVIYKAYDLRV